MTDQRCVVCDRSGPDREEIENQRTGEQVRVCWDCLRSQLRAKADASDERARRLLERDAERFGWQLWEADAVVYLLPPLVDEPAAAEEDGQALADVAQG
jgi:hypothetical protein